MNESLQPEQPSKSNILYLLRELLETNGISGADLSDILEFSFGEDQVSERFLGILRRVFPLLTAFHCDAERKPIRRKVNKGLYLRHPLRTAVLADYCFEDLKEKGLITDADYERLILSSLFHDVLELTPQPKRKHVRLELSQTLKHKGFSEELINQVLKDIVFLTPRKKPVLTYFERQRKEILSLIRVFNTGNKIPLIIRAFDSLANIKETIDDLSQEREKGQMRPLSDRYYVWRERLVEIEQKLGKEVLLVELLKEGLRKIEDFLF